MRTLLLVIIGFLAGAVVGDRFGLPRFASSAASAGLNAVGAAIAGAGNEISAPANNSVGAATASANAGLTLNDAGLAIIKESEGLRLAAYRSGSQWLIGYGHSRTAREGMTITQAQAERLLREDVADSEETVRRQVIVPVTRNQFSAMVSLAYNLGAGGFSRTAVLERINAGDFAGAADGFLAHDRGRIDGVLQKIPHLTERRRKERALFLRP